MKTPFHSLRFVAGIIAITLASTSTSNAWDSQGHMMVAAVAYNQLTPQAKSRVDALLLLNPDRDNWFDDIPVTASDAQKKMMVFVMAATWPDRIKSDPDYQTDGTHNDHHF